LGGGKKKGEGEGGTTPDRALNRFLASGGKKGGEHLCFEIGAV